METQTNAWLMGLLTLVLAAVVLVVLMGCRVPLRPYRYRGCLAAVGGRPGVDCRVRLSLPARRWRKFAAERSPPAPRGSGRDPKRKRRFLAMVKAAERQ